jgi:hypothetical protein
MTVAGDGRRTRIEICPSATFITTIPTQIGLGLNPCLRRDVPSTLSSPKYSVLKEERYMYSFVKFSTKLRV